MQSKLWRVEADRLQLLEPSLLNLEERLENWLCQDARLLSDGLLIIGRQIAIRGGTLDILAVDQDANLVVVELKREKAAREVVVQALDYASSIEEFGREELENITRSFLNEDFDAAFNEHFRFEVPETVNERQRIYLVASSFDTSTSRLVEYLSRIYGVDINCVSFSYFKTDDGEFMLRSALLSEDDVERRARATDAKKRSIATEAELRDIASSVGVVDLWDTAIDGFSSFFGRYRSQTTLYFFTRHYQRQRTLLTIFPSESSSERGLAVSVVFEHFSNALNIEESKVRQICPVSARRAFHGSYSKKDNSFYLRKEDLDALILLITQSVVDEGLFQQNMGTTDAVSSPSS